MTVNRNYIALLTLPRGTVWKFSGQVPGYSSAPRRKYIKICLNISAVVFRILLDCAVIVFLMLRIVLPGQENARRPDGFTDNKYDLVIVGAGISGLTLAWLARRKLGHNARILILDNHDYFEKAAVEQLSATLGPYGFDAEKDIAAITVNRWPHGYAYEYNELVAPQDWSPEKGPHIAGRKRFSNIVMAGSDASAYA